MSVKIAIIAENTAVGRGLIGEHGLAIGIERGESRVLFDTGQGFALANNTIFTGFDEKNLDALVLSHGHYDHTGAVPIVVELAKKPLTVYAHPAALERKYRKGPKWVDDVGMPYESRHSLEEKAVLRLTAAPTEVAPGITTTGEIVDRIVGETPDEGFCLDQEGKEPDPIRDDQALIVESAEGLVVVLGCAHAGVISTLNQVDRISGGKPIRALIGGMHLRNASDEQLATTIEELKRRDIGIIYPMHCTGIKAVVALWRELPDRCGFAGAGSVLNFE